MTTHPNCKINLGLHVTGRRADGYHTIETVFLPVPLCDRLTIEPAGQTGFVQSGIALDCPASENICVNAYRSMCRKYPQIGPVQISLEKNIPFGAGLGGGSSDAAHTIIMLNKLYDLHLTADELCAQASEIGADCPFFILNRPCHATGIGERLEPLAFDLPSAGLRLMLLKPPVAVSTAEAYRGIVPRSAATDLRQAVLGPPESWRETIVNDFEATVFEKHPSIAGLKQALYDSGAVYASMSGSGSALFGVFKELPAGQLPFEVYRG